LAKVVMNRFEATLGNSEESLDSMLRRFKKQVSEDGTLEAVRNRKYFLKKSLKRKEKSKRARIKLLKKSKFK